MPITKQIFGKLSGKQEITKYTLSNGNGVSVSIINYGGIITSIIMPDKMGVAGDIVLGFDSLDDYTSEDYRTKGPYLGALIGRYANRISNSKFTLEGKEYALAANDGENHVHGGVTGFDKVVWEAEEIATANGPALKLGYLSKDGEEGYPGNLQVSVVYSLSEDNELKISYRAETDKATPVALTNHSYFNLAPGKENTLGHIVTINADEYLVIDKNFIPSGEIKPVEGTPLAFKEPHVIGERIEEVEGGGYAHTYVLNKDNSGANTPALAATVYEPASGRQIELYTSEPGLIFYPGTFLDGSLRGKDGKVYSQYDGLALETQHFPDSPNQPEFPSTILRPGKTFESTTVYAFSVRRE